jgi:hypothetical protein
MATTGKGTVSFATARATSPSKAVASAATPVTPAARGGFMVSDKGGDTIPPLEAGVYQAVCVGLYDIGTVEGPFGAKRKCVLVWEIPGATIEVERDGAPVTLPRNISNTYTMSLNEKARFRQDLEAIRCKRLTKEETKAFDAGCLLGMNAQIQVTQTEKEGKVYANVETVMACPKGMAAVVPAVEPVLFHFGAVEKADESALPAECPRWIRKKIMASPEWAERGGSPMKDE